MLVWLLMLAGIMAVWLVMPDALGEKKKKLIFLGFALAILVFILGSRDEYSVANSDVYGYLKWYRRAIALPLNELLEYTAMEKGYLVLNDVLSWFVPWDRFIMYFQAAFCTGVMFWYLYRNVDNVFFAVITYICIGAWQFFLTTFRQAIAICICLIALELIKKEKRSCDIGALLLIILATTIHTTAWVFLIVFIVRGLKLRKGFIAFCVLSVLLISVFIDDLVDIANETLGRGYTAGMQRGNAFGGIVPILIYVGTFVLCFIAWKNDNSFTKDYSFEIKLLALGLCIYVFRYNTTVFERISFYFTPVIAVLLPAAVEHQKLKTERRIITVIGISLCIFLFAYRVVQQYGNYRFYWD
ncbi:MAG: EpsG family protein [Clostridia bacterium]|nr:EpsG family protein [Clostridia bacterium]